MDISAIEEIRRRFRSIIRVGLHEFRTSCTSSWDVGFARPRWMSYLKGVSAWASRTRRAPRHMFAILDTNS
jgi:hypothetical protein